jgi:hypothetical protein
MIPIAYIIKEEGKRHLYCHDCVTDDDMMFDDDTLDLAKPIYRRDELEVEFDGMIPNCYSCCEEIK